LPLVEIALITNLMPLFTALIGYFYLKEKLETFDVVVLIVSFGGILVLIFGGDNSE